VPVEVAFHFNAPDRVAYAARLLRKAHHKGARLWVRVVGDELTALDQALWVQSPGEFLPHSVAGDPPAVRLRSPIHLDPGEPQPGQHEVLVNLAPGVPSGHERFERVIEVVTLDDADRAAARERWRAYKAQGIEPLRHDLKTSAGA
jgi:DNA polymerase III subunit chi